MLARTITSTFIHSKELPCIRRLLCTSSVNGINQRWREEKGLPLNPNAYGVLTDRPDYTFLDGRPTPYGVNQKRRILKQQEISEKIIQLSKEVDFAVARHKQLQLDAQQRRNDILNSKLKPKGDLLLHE